MTLDGGHIRPKKSLGQNFLKDPHYLRKIVDAARIGPEDQAVEIGPGLGHLTRLLAQKARKVLAVELDEGLVERLRAEFSGVPNVEIVHADALKFPFEDLQGAWKVVANLPYYISTPIIQRLIEVRGKFTSMTLMLQKEVAERIVSPPGSREYGYLSALVQFYTEPAIRFIVPPGAFTPPPEVESAVVAFSVRERPAALVKNERFFFRVVKAAFSQRRKTLRNALKQLGMPAESMAAVERESGIDLGRRAETLSIAEFGKLSDVLLPFGSEGKRGAG